MWWTSCASRACVRHLPGWSSWQGKGLRCARCDGDGAERVKLMGRWSVCAERVTVRMGG